MEKQIFKVGDKVFDAYFGWGQVINDKHITTYPILVDYSDNCIAYTIDGRLYINTIKPSLSFTEYTIQGFSQERPKPQPKVGEMCVFWDKNSTNDRRVVSKLERINKRYYDETDTPWDNCITLEEFYKQQNK